MKIASALVAFVGIVLAGYATFVAGQLVLTGVLIGLLYTAATRKSKKRPVGPKSVAAKRSAEEHRAEVPLSVALLLPVMLIAEKLDLQSRSIGHNAIGVYAAALWTYHGISLNTDTNVLTPWTWSEGVGGTLFTTAVGTVALGVLTMDAYVTIGFGVAILVALETFYALRGSVPAAEAHLVAALCLVVAVDVIANHHVPSNLQTAIGNGTKVKLDLRQTTGTNLEHVIGRSALVTVWLFAAITRRLFQWFRLTGTASRTIAAGAVLAISVFLAAGHAFVVLYLLNDAKPGAQDFVKAFVGDVWPSVNVFRDLSELISAWRGVCVAAWLVVVPIASFGLLTFGEAFPKIIRRKAFHLLAVAMFVAPTALDPHFLVLWWCVAIACAVIAETSRCHKLFGSESINALLRHVTDERDSGIIRTHIYLMVGCALPILMNYRVSYRHESKVPWFVTSLRDFLPGLGALGVLDAFAAAAGVTFGKAKLIAMLPESWTADNQAMSHKSFVGSAAGVAALWLFAFLPLVILHFVTSGHGATQLDVLSIPWQVIVRIGVISFVTAMYEAVTDGVDNLELPVFCATVTRLIL